MYESEEATNITAIHGLIILMVSINPAHFSPKIIVINEDGVNTKIRNYSNGQYLFNFSESSPTINLLEEWNNIYKLFKGQYNKYNNKIAEFIYSFRFMPTSRSNYRSCIDILIIFN